MDDHRTTLLRLRRNAFRIFEKVNVTEDPRECIVYTLTRPTDEIVSPNEFQERQLTRRLEALQEEGELITNLLRLTKKAPHAHSIAGQSKSSSDVEIAA